MLAIPVIGLMWTIWRQPDLTVRGLLSAGAPHLYLLIVIALSLASRERLLAEIDRRFFRDARDRERILLDLASEIGRTETIEDAVALAEHALDASLHPSTVRVRLHDSTQTFPADLPTTDTLMLQRLESGRGDSIRSRRHRDRRADPQSRSQAHRHPVAWLEAFRGAVQRERSTAAARHGPADRDGRRERRASAGGRRRAADQARGAEPARSQRRPRDSRVSAVRNGVRSRRRDLPRRSVSAGANAARGSDDWRALQARPADRARRHGRRLRGRGSVDAASRRGEDPPARMFWRRWGAAAIPARSAHSRARCRNRMWWPFTITVRSRPVEAIW